MYILIKSGLIVFYLCISRKYVINPTLLRLSICRVTEEVGEQTEQKPCHHLLILFWWFFTDILIHRVCILTMFVFYILFVVLSLCSTPCHNEQQHLKPDVLPSQNTGVHNKIPPSQMNAAQTSKRPLSPFSYPCKLSILKTKCLYQ